MPSSTSPAAVHRVAAPYVNASVAGVALGFVLLASYVFAGRGIGASGAFADIVGAAIDRTAPALVTGRPALADRLPAVTRLADEWIVWQLIGVCVGAAISARLAGRWRTNAGAHPRNAQSDAASRSPSLSRAIAGGVLMGVGARLAYGCTSGLALSGGALLATGAWLFIVIAFATAILVAFVARASQREAA